MKKFLAIFFVLILVAGGGYTWRVSSASSPTISSVKALSTRVNTGQPAKLDWPNYGQAAIGAVGYGILATHGSSKPLPTASIAKLITALCVLEKHPLALGQTGSDITITQKDVQRYDDYYIQGGSLVEIKAGEKITEYQALQAMLLPSGNNMADTLAEWAFGSIDDYLAYANKYVKHLGLTQTQLAGDASGFDSRTVSTSSDLIKLGEAVMQNPVLAQIVGQKTAKVPVAGEISNINPHIGTDGIVGIKTGNNDGNKGAFLFAAKYRYSPQRTVIIIGVIMGAPSLLHALGDSLPLLASSKAGFSERQIVRAGEVVANYPAPWGSSAKAVAQEDLSVLAWRGKPIDLSVQLPPIVAPAKAGQAVGKISASINGHIIDKSSVVLKNSIPTPQLKWRILNP